MAKVLIAPMQLVKIGGAWKDLLLQNGHELVYLQGGPAPGARAARHPQGVRRQPGGLGAVHAGACSQAHPQLKVIARAGVGYDAVDVKAATDQGIAVCITPGTNQDAVAEYTFTLMLALAKELVSQSPPVSRAAGRGRRCCRCAAGRSASSAWAASARPSPSAARPSA